MQTNEQLHELIAQIAEQAESEGVQPDGELGGAVHQFVQKNVKYRPETEFYIVMLVTIELANRDSRRRGFESQAHEAAVKVGLLKK